MNLFDYAVEFHSLLERKGPGSQEQTIRALSCIPDFNNMSNMLVIGCGTGEEVFTIAPNTDANIIAIDIIPPFIDELRGKIDKKGLSSRVLARLQSMDNLDYLPNYFDVVWAENSISHIGLARGLKEWHKYIKRDGYIVVSEICWLTDERNDEIKVLCENISKDIDTVSNKKNLFSQCGYEIICDFVLPEKCWLDNYYLPMQNKVPSIFEKIP